MEFIGDDIYQVIILVIVCYLSFLKLIPAIMIETNKIWQIGKRICLNDF